MKTSKYQKWKNKNSDAVVGANACGEGDVMGWNAALNAVNSMIKRRNKEFEGNWQHEDIEYLMEDIKDMIQND